MTENRIDLVSRCCADLEVAVIITAPDATVEASAKFNASGRAANVRN
jgi:hypothetical protein